MAKGKLTGSQRAIKTAADAFRSTAGAMRRSRTAERKFAAASRGLSGLGQRIRRQEPNARSRLTDDIADSTDRIAKGLRVLRGGKFKPARFEIGAQVVDSLELLSRSLVECAGSFTLQGCSNGESKKMPTDQIAGLQSQASDVAFRAYLAATVLGEAIGSVTALVPRTFRFPVTGPAGRCTCDPAATLFPPTLDANTLQFVDAFDVKRGERMAEDVDEGLALVDDLAKSLTQLFATIASVLAILVLFIINCPIACGPPFNAFVGAAAAPGIPALGAVGATPLANRIVQPTFDVIWTYCCDVSCFLVLSQTYLKTVTTSHNAGGPVRTNVAGGTARATTLGTTAIAAYVALAPPTPGIVPPVALPPRPVC